MRYGDHDAVGFKLFGHFQRAHGHGVTGNDQNLVAVAQALGAAQFKFVAVLVQHQWHLATQKSHVDRPLMYCDLRHGWLDVERVPGATTVSSGLARIIARSSVA